MLAEFKAEYEKIQARVKENHQLIEQTQHEVNRMRERSVAVSAQLSRVESNFDTIPRADIKAAYEGTLDTRTRRSWVGVNENTSSGAVSTVPSQL